MPGKMNQPVFTINDSKLVDYDPQDPKDLSLLWSAFSKTSHLIEEGDRLRNFSWRLWNRERLCCARSEKQVSRSAPAPFSTSPQPPVPQLSTSVESTSTTATEDDSDSSPPRSIPTRICHDSKERHITPYDLRDMVVSIKQTQELKPCPRPLPAPEPETSRQKHMQAQLPQPTPPRHVATESSTSTVATAVTDSFASTGGKSDTETSVSSNTSSQHSIVRGFTPGASGMTSYTSKYQLAPQPPQPQPILKKPESALAEISRKKGKSMFQLGCSSGSGGSGDEASLRESLLSRSLRSSGGQAASKKQTSFKDEVAVMKPKAHEDAAVFDSTDDESDCDSEISDSAIDDDDDDAWEDEGSEAQEPEPKKDQEMKFYRVDSAAHLPTRRSALTLNLQDQRNGTSSNLTAGFRATPAYKRSRTSTPNGPSMPGSPEEDSQMEMRARQMGSSKPIIPTTTNQQQPLAPLTSPKTTRRNMVAGELSESLRKVMMTERKQRNPLGIEPGQMRRAHTVFDVNRLSKLPENGELQKSADSKDVYQRKIPSWNQYFDKNVSEFNQTGW